MKTIKIKIKKAPVETKAYGGQHNYSLDLKSNKSTTFNDDNPYAINNTLAAVDEDEANIEAELGEMIHGDFDMDGMNETMKVGGKKHYAGGTPLTVPDGSFVFSDAKKLRISGDTLVDFGKPEDTKKKYTPAQLAKQYDVNKYKAILDDKNSDPVSKRTAEMMISNYENKLAKLALVQEAKKGFPNGIPEIAMPYLMIQQQEAGQEESMFKNGGQYKYDNGGGVSEKIKYDRFGLPVDPHLGDKLVTANPQTGIRSSDWNKSKYTKDQWRAIRQELGYRTPDSGNNKEDNKAFQIFLKTNYPEIVAEAHGDPSKGGYGIPLVTKEDTDGFLGVRWDYIVDKIRASKAEAAKTTTPLVTTIGPPPVEEPKATVTPEEREANPFEPSTVQKAKSRYWTQDKINVASAFQNRNNIKKYIPWEAPINGVTADPTFYDPNRELASNAEMMNTEMMYNSQFAGPQAASVRNAAVSAQSGANAANTLARYDNLNVGVANTFAGVNAEMTNAVMAGNTVRMNNLYKGNVIANQQYDNSRAQASDVIRKNLLSGLDNKQKAEWINTWYPQYNIDPRDGSIDYTKGHSSVSQGSSSKSETLIDIYKKLKADPANAGVPDDMLKEQAKQVLGISTRNTIDSDGNMRSTYPGPLPTLLNNLHQR